MNTHVILSEAKDLTISLFEILRRAQNNKQAIDLFGVSFETSF